MDEQPALPLYLCSGYMTDFLTSKSQLIKEVRASRLEAELRTCLNDKPQKAGLGQKSHFIGQPGSLRLYIVPRLETMVVLFTRDSKKLRERISTDTTIMYRVLR